MIECKTTNFTNPSSTQYQNIWNYIHSVFLWPIIHLQTGNRFPVRELTTCSPIKRPVERNSPPLQHQVASNLHLKDVTHEFSEGFFYPSSSNILDWNFYELYGNQKFVWKWMLMHVILYYIKYKHFITVYVCNFCFLRESIQPKSSKSFFSPKLPKWLQLVTQAAAPWTFEGWQNFPHLWQVLEDVHSTTLLNTGGCSTNLT